jgi:hypothetical protein
MTKKEITKLIVSHGVLTDSVQNLAEIVNTLIDNNIDIAKEIQLVRDENITLCNKLNEVELILEKDAKPLVMPVVKRKRRMEINTPYPKKQHPFTKVYNRLRRIINAST